jgi:hypothetical protein
MGDATSLITEIFYNVHSLRKNMTITAIPVINPENDKDFLIGLMFQLNHS